MIKKKSNPRKQSRAPAEDFYHRWSRRKQDARAGSTQPQPPDKPQAEDASEEQPVLELPPIETLDEHSDYTPFLTDGVDEKLKKLALRKLFGSPQFNVMDGLDDYAEDYTTFEPLGDVVTHIQRQWEERERLLADAESSPEEPKKEGVGPTDDGKSKTDDFSSGENPSISLEETDNSVKKQEDKSV